MLQNPPVDPPFDPADDLSPDGVVEFDNDLSPDSGAGLALDQITKSLVNSAIDWDLHIFSVAVHPSFSLTHAQITQ
jgi:hypothetical protein